LPSFLGPGTRGVLPRCPWPSSQLSAATRTLQRVRILSASTEPPNRAPVPGAVETLACQARARITLTVLDCQVPPCLVGMSIVFSLPAISRNAEPVQGIQDARPARGSNSGDLPRGQVLIGIERCEPGPAAKAKRRRERDVAFDQSWSRPRTVRLRLGRGSHTYNLYRRIPCR
jgi:hypothetical protein